MEVVCGVVGVVEVCSCSLLLYVLATFKVMLRLVPTCDSHTHGADLLRNQAVGTMTRYPTQSYYLYHSECIHTALILSEAAQHPQRQTWFDQYSAGQAGLTAVHKIPLYLNEAL